MSDAFSIQIIARGEGLDYTDTDGVFRFDLGRTGSTIQLHAYRCTDESSRPRQFSEEQQQRILPRILAHLQRHGSPVTVLSEPPPKPLRSVDDILQQRFVGRSANKPALEH